MKKISVFLGLILGIFGGFCQQNDFFREVKEDYNKREKFLKQKYNELFLQISDLDKIKLQIEFEEVKKKLDNMRNIAYLEALIKTKVAQDLALIKNSAKNITKKPENYTQSAEYPTGIEGIRQEIVEHFYAENINTDEGLLSAEIVFVIDETGELSDVKVMGQHYGFNKQAEIAMYLLTHKFTPAYLNGTAIKSRFRFPLRMRF